MIKSFPEYIYDLKILCDACYKKFSIKEKEFCFCESCKISWKNFIQSKEFDSYLRTFLESALQNGHKPQEILDAARK